MVRNYTRFVMAAVLALLTACGTKRPPIDTLTPDQLVDRGMAELANRKWTDAITTFERFVVAFPTHPRMQEVRFRLSEGYFGKKEYITAANEFARLATDYPAGPYADDARFKVCESYERLSPKAPLDQQYTRAAIDHCQSLEAYYPTSEFVPRARQISTDLLNKLGEKQFRAAEFYFKRGAVDSAILYYETTLREYPTTTAAPKALLRLYEAYTNLGYRDEATTARDRLLRDYPESAEAKSLAAAASTTSL